MNYKDSYEKVINTLKTIIGNANKQGHIIVRIEDIENAIPELQESKEEKIRKEIIDFLWKEKIFLQEAHSSVENSPKYRFVMDAIAWLEKQGEQKVPIKDFKAKNWYVSEVDGKIHDMTYNPTYKVEPKFHEGDWIINDQGSAFKIAYIDAENCRYVFEIGGYTKEEMNYENIAFANNHYRKWAIDDAKDGDVLVSKDNQPFIYNGKYDTFWVGAYCGMNCTGDSFLLAQEKCHWTEREGVKPSSKEQRKQLFQNMRAEGCLWNEKEKRIITSIQELPKMDDFNDLNDWLKCIQKYNEKFG